MSLQGTLDTFALDDVLRLLAATAKSGKLEITGRDVVGGVWLTRGEVVAASVTGTGPDAAVAEVLLEILSLTEGAFVFDAGAEHPSPGQPLAVEALLAEVDELRRAGVPPGTWLTLRPEGTGGDVTLSPDRWRVVVAVGAGATVADVATLVGLPVKEAGRLARDLATGGLVSLGAPAPAASSQLPGPAPPMPTAGPVTVAPNPNGTPPGGADRSAQGWGAVALPPEPAPAGGADGEPSLPPMAGLEGMVPPHIPPSQEVSAWEEAPVWSATSSAPAGGDEAPKLVAEPLPPADVAPVGRAADSPIAGDLGIIIPGFDSLLAKDAPGDAAPAPSATEAARPGEGPPPDAGVVAPPADAGVTAPPAVPPADAATAPVAPDAPPANTAPHDRDLLLRYLSSVKK